MPKSPDSVEFQLTQEIGATGLKQYSGYIYEEFLRQLWQSKWKKIVREMSENDPIIGGTLRAIEMLVRQTSWRVEPASESPEDRQRAEFVQGALYDMSHTWQDTLSEILSFVPWGWSFVECVYKKRGGDVNDSTKRSKFNDGRIGWRKWAIRAQDTLSQWIFDESGGMRAMVQSPPPDFISRTIPIEKALHFTTTSRKRNPEGFSVLRNAFTSFYNKTNLQRIEAIGIERDLAGIPTAWVPADLLQAELSADKQSVYNAIKDIVINMRRDEQEGLIFPLAYDADGHKLYDLTLLTTGGRRQFDTDVVVKRYNAQIAISMLADFILLGHEQVGSYALAGSKTTLFSVALGAFLDSICEVINRHAIPRLFKYNGWPTNKTPTIVHGDIDTVDLNELGTFIERLSGAGFTLHLADEVQRHILTKAKLPVSEKSVVAEPVKDDDDTGEPKTATEPDDETALIADGEKWWKRYADDEAKALIGAKEEE
jgi:hypothetical protein